MPTAYRKGVSEQPHAPTDVRTIDERANHCFGCSPTNPQGLHLRFEIATEETGTITSSATVELTHLHEGPPGFIHGGIIATLLERR